MNDRIIQLAIEMTLDRHIPKGTVNNMLASSSRYWNENFQLKKMKVTYLHYSIELEIVRALLTEAID